MPKVSIVVPVYNVDKYLPRCVYSLLKQTLKDIEIILVDDGSSDNCPVLCDKYAESDSRIKVIHKKNGGLGYARNSGMKIAVGEYIAFVDSDDYVDAEMFKAMYEAAVENNADFVRVDNYKETVDGKIINLNYNPPMREGLYTKNELRDSLLYPQFGMLPEDSGDKYVSCSVWRNIYRNRIIKENDLKFVSERDLISEDIPFNLDFMIKAECAYVINKKFYHYIVNDKSLTQTYRKDRFERELILYHDLEKRLRKYGLYKECEIRLYRHLLARARMCIKAELFSGQNGKKIKSNILNILQCDEMRLVFTMYPFRKMPIKYRFVDIAMKYNMIIVIKAIKKYL